jgi:hypothetical protein
VGEVADSTIVVDRCRRIDDDMIAQTSVWLDDGPGKNYRAASQHDG